MDVFPDPVRDDPGTMPDMVMEPDVDPMPDPLVDDPAMDPEPEEEVQPDVDPDPEVPAVLLWEENFSEYPVRWEYQNGEWESREGAFCQDSINSFAELWVPDETWEDFAVEVSIKATDADISAVQNIMALLFRVQGISRNKYYRCGLDFKSHILTIYEFDQDVLPGYRRLCEVSLESVVPEMDQWYTLQAAARGPYLSCRWVSGEGEALAEVTAYDDQYISGSIGLFAHNIAGCFDNVFVWSRPPDTWPYPAPESAACP